MNFPLLHAFHSPSVTVHIFDTHPPSPSCEMRTVSNKFRVATRRLQPGPPSLPTLPPRAFQSFPCDWKPRDADALASQLATLSVESPLGSPSGLEPIVESPFDTPNGSPPPSCSSQHPNHNVPECPMTHSPPPTPQEQCNPILFVDDDSEGCPIVGSNSTGDPNEDACIDHLRVVALTYYGFALSFYATVPSPDASPDVGPNADKCQHGCPNHISLSATKGWCISREYFESNPADAARTAGYLSTFPPNESVRFDQDFLDFLMKGASYL
ncbi:hypothetical protein M413DRAFT_31271 [Hebeloma cylindrosporum]|uniref:Uncharacterized protein n=1 Tax=Hebeloma cylindrosporum TaxID=76867 RepID=A0A0C3BZJ8_HEBCY|nr:hypothetical protein M413DRAFT_31271 [Hebeloma cylindrosporum h7]